MRWIRVPSTPAIGSESTSVCESAPRQALRSSSTSARGLPRSARDCPEPRTTVMSPSCSPCVRSQPRMRSCAAFSVADLEAARAGVVAAGRERQQHVAGGLVVAGLVHLAQDLADRRQQLARPARRARPGRRDLALDDVAAQRAARLGPEVGDHPRRGDRQRRCAAELGLEAQLRPAARHRRCRRRRSRRSSGRAPTAAAAARTRSRRASSSAPRRCSRRPSARR